MNEEKISSRQVIMILVCFYLGSKIVANPSASAGEDAWFSSLVGWASGYIVISITAAIAMLNPGRSLVEIMIICFGKKVGKSIGIFFVFYFLWLAAEVIRSYSFYAKTAVYQRTPYLAIIICYALVAAFVVKIGLEALGRVSEILLLVAISIIAVTLISLVSNFHPDVFLPMFKNGVMPPLFSGLSTGIQPFGQCLIALTILPNLNDPKKTFKVLSVSTLIAGGLMFIIMFRDISIEGVYTSSRAVFPSLKSFNLMPGVDVTPLLGINVIFFGVIKVSLLFYGAAKILGEVLGLKDFKLLVLPLVAFVIGIAFIPKFNLSENLYFAGNFVPLMEIPILLILPIVILIISLAKKSNPKGEVRQLE